MLGIAAVAQLPLGGLPFVPHNVGSVRLYHTAEDLERRLGEQKRNTFGRNWFEDFVQATEAAIAKAEAVGSDRHDAAQEKAVEAVKARTSEAKDTGIFSPRELVIALNRAAHVLSAAKSSRHAELAASIAKRSIRPASKPEPINEYLAISGFTQHDLDELQRRAVAAVNNLDLAAIEKDIMAAIGRMRR